MNLTWEKVILWILAIVVILVIIAFLAINLRDNPNSLIGKIWAVFGSAGGSSP